MITAKIRKRSQAISIDGRLDDRYFAVTSEVPRKIVDSRISAMPRNGRSARAGASGFFSGKDFSCEDTSDEVASSEFTGTRSSLAAAADGGVTGANSGEMEIIESARPDKTIMRRDRQGPKTGSLYARLPAAG